MQHPKWVMVLLALATVFSGCNSCNNSKKDPVTEKAVEEMKLSIRIRHFEQDLFATDSLHPEKDFARLAAAYPELWDVYVENIMEFGPASDPNNLQALAGFVRNKYIRDLKRECDKYFSDFTPYAKELNEACKRYKFHFPQAQVPEFVTMISAFNYASPVIADTVVGIGLDFYLGKNFEPYRARNVNFPEYIIRRLEKEYLVASTMKYFLYSRYAPEAGKKRFLDQIIQEGRILYVLDKLLPDVADTIKIGYTKEQLEWCYANEKQMWAHYLDKKLLYSTDMMDYQRYIGEGAFTSAPDVPAESAPRIGVWTGWRIVQAYMQKNPKVTLQQLMQEQDYQKILNSSLYRPA